MKKNENYIPMDLYLTWMKFQETNLRILNENDIFPPQCHNFNYFYALKSCNVHQYNKFKKNGKSFKSF